MKIFKLPDLGEGLQEAEISAWHVGRRRSRRRPADGLGRDREGDRRDPEPASRQDQAAVRQAGRHPATSAHRSSRS